jgi:hypothetical protein
MYYTGRHYLTREPIFVEKDFKKKVRQKEIVIKKDRPFSAKMDG